QLIRAFLGGQPCATADTPSCSATAHSTDLELAAGRDALSITEPAQRAQTSDRRGPLGDASRQLTVLPDPADFRSRGWIVRRALALADLLGLITSFVFAERVFANRVPGTVDRIGELQEVALFMLTLPAWLVVAKLHGLYDRDEERTDYTTADDVVGVFHLVTVGAWLFYIGSRAVDVARPPLDKVFFFWLLAIVVVPVGRSIARAACRRQPAYVQNTVILGCGRIGQLIASKLVKHPEYGLNLVGFVDDTPLERRDDVSHVHLLGAPDELPAIVRLHRVERVIVAFTRHPHEETLDLLRSMKDLDVQVDVVPRLFEIVGPRANIHTVEGLPLVGLPPPRLSRSSLVLKRALDVAGAGVGLLLLAPVFLVVALAIRLDSPGPVFFRQVRMGFGGRPFRIFKFRTMVADADARKRELASLNMHARGGGDPRMFKVAD